VTGPTMAIPMVVQLEGLTHFEIFYGNGSIGWFIILFLLYKISIIMSYASTIPHIKKGIMNRNIVVDKLRLDILKFFQISHFTCSMHFPILFYITTYNFRLLILEGSTYL
jgi:hypothetical protein